MKTPYGISLLVLKFVDYCGYRVVLRSIDYIQQLGIKSCASGRIVQALEWGRVVNDFAAMQYNAGVREHILLEDINSIREGSLLVVEFHNDTSEAQVSVAQVITRFQIVIANLVDEYAIHSATPACNSARTSFTIGAERRFASLQQSASSPRLTSADPPRSDDVSLRFALAHGERDERGRHPPNQL